MSDFLFRGSLAKLDPDVFELTQLESERQARKLILIASESTAPMAVRERAIAYDILHSLILDAELARTIDATLAEDDRPQAVDARVVPDVLIGRALRAAVR